MTEARSKALEELAATVNVWRTAVCAKTPYPSETCDGDNHLEDCPVELARQDVITAHNLVERNR